MKLFEKIRNYGFWIVDYFKGNPVRNHIQDIKLILDENDQKKSKKRIKDLLTTLLDHAVETTEFYAEFKDFRSIHDFPVINKNNIRNSFKNFQSRSFTHSKTYEISTSGSTGLPFKVYHNKDKRNRNTADVLYFGLRNGYKIGERILYIKIWNKFNSKGKLKNKIENIYPIDILNLKDNDLRRIFDQLNNSDKEVHITGYVSAIETICSFIERENFHLKFKVKSIITMSEAISKQSKIYIERILKSKVLARYSNNENGIIAQQRVSSEYYYINSASYLVEIFDIEDDILVEDGKLGRIVVTDFFNLAMPMIRYDTGDLGVLKSISNGSFETLVLSSIEGRKMDALFNTKGEIISSFIVSNFMWDYTELLQYQFIQTGEKSYLIKLNVDKEFLHEKKLIDAFLNYLGEDALISIEYVNEIPLLASGKRKRVLNTWKSLN